MWFDFETFISFPPISNYKCSKSLTSQYEKYQLLISKDTCDRILKYQQYNSNRRQPSNKTKLKTNFEDGVCSIIISVIALQEERDMWSWT